MIVAGILLALVLIFIAAYRLFLQRPQFGKASTGQNLERIINSPNYKGQSFQNRSNTPQLAEGVSYYTVLKEFFFTKNKRVKPASKLPSKKEELLMLHPEDDVIVWFGHSSYFMQLDGKKLLVDPVFSGNASPLSFTTKSFDGADVYSVADMPEIDYLFITHDHFDHLDYKTILALRPKVKKVITSLGVAAHLEFWGYSKSAIIENDWNEQVLIDNGFVVNTVTARHFSGRTFKRNVTLWSSFILTTPNWKIYIGGDSGYDHHFKTIGDEYGPFDLAILENGQYNAYWKYIHMMPEETVQAAIDLKAQRLFPVHWGKFALSLHDWDEPIKRVVKEGKVKNMPLMHPMIGEVVYLSKPIYSQEWWVGIE